MAVLEKDYNNDDYQLIATQDTANISEFDYIRIIVYQRYLPPTVAGGTPGTEVRRNASPRIANASTGEAIFYSSTSTENLLINTSPFSENTELKTRYVGGDSNDFKIYTADDGSIYVKPNDIFDEYDLPNGKFKIHIDFLNQVSPKALLPSFLGTLPFPEYFSQFDLNGDGVIDNSDAVAWVTAGRPDISGEVQDIYMNIVSPPPTGDGSESTSEYFNNPNFDETLGSIYQFIIKEISTSRKEVRLKLANGKISEHSPVIQDLTDQFNYGGDSYGFRHLLSFGTGEHTAITNYHFDAVTDGKDNQSIILRLYSPLSGDVGPLSQVTIEQEILTTQSTEIYYFSDVVVPFQGGGLDPDPIENWISTNQNESFQLENYNALSASITEASLLNFISGSAYNYPNLNTDYKLFENHTHFGSAKRKLVNFKNKVETIQNHLSDISSSLSSSGVSMGGDSSELIEYRQNLFTKIQDEINSFTPYERFLYYDGQNESTASAPGIGINYADSFDYPVFVGTSGGSLLAHQDPIHGGDGFDIVYHLKSRTSSSLYEFTGRYANLFANKYYAENKPFYNYSSSIYLSFMQKHNGEALTWENRNSQNTPSVPRDAMYKNKIATPTGSYYQRHIYQVSQSYWIPANEDQDYDLSLLPSDAFYSDSTQAQILSSSGQIKTGSYQIKDSSGQYQNLTTVVTQSGVPFKGSVMPAGELFRIFYRNTLYSGSTGYFDVDNQTSGSDLTDDMLQDYSGNKNIATIVGGGAGLDPTIAEGLTFKGKTYGKSIQFVSESTHELRYQNTYNDISKHTDFSLSIWAKRYHQFSASKDGVAEADGYNADNSSDATNKVVGIFQHASTIPSFGISYQETTNRLFAGVRGTHGSEVSVQKIMSNQLLNWHHIVLTYQSSSATGLNLYVDGVLEDTEDTTGAFLNSDWGNDFSGSASDVLQIGSNDVLGGSGVFYNGFIQYPRIYSRVLNKSDVKQLYETPDAVIETKTTDVRISLNDPTNVQPFGELYHTSSAEWTTWYDGMYDSASAFDTDNIHSLENNLPLYIQESNDYDDLKDFLSLQGEQYDLIKNHIDGIGTIHNRNYKKLESPPENTYPMLLENMGWKGMSPFSGSLSDSLGNYLNSVTTLDDIKNNTWRKTLNNLIYIYKTKGTQNSVRALLNTYGYPPDIIPTQEYGGSTGPIIASSPGYIKSTPPEPNNRFDTNLKIETGSISFTDKKQKLFNYMVQNDFRRTLNLDWWMDSAEPNTIEFVYKHKGTTSTQEILKSSGSGDESLWDLRLVPSTDGISSSFEFRLNNTNSGSSAIADNAVSMSTNYVTMTDGQLWNVMLQRMSSSVSGSGINQYRLHASLQDGPSIQTYNYVTMSISGGLSADSNYYANQNWLASGSRHADSSSNLVIGATTSGSLSEIKSWSTPLSISRFRQHTLNKFSSVGNSSNSYSEELIYHFRLNENYSTSSISSSTQTPYIVDSAPKSTLTTDYSFSIPLEIITGSILYGFDIIDVITFGNQDNSTNKENDNNIIINPAYQVVGNLNPKISSIKKVTQPNSKPLFNTSPRLEINRSPQDTINRYIINRVDTFNLENYYAKPEYYYSSSYNELDTLRKNFFSSFPIEVDTNKFIRAHENIFNQSLIEGIKTVIPVRSTLSETNTGIGVTIKPTILEKQKYENEKALIEVNPNLTSGSIVFVENTEYKQAVLTSTLETPKTGSISMGNAYVTESVDSTYITPNFLQSTGYTASLELPKSGSIFVTFKNTGSLELPKTGSISMGNLYVSESVDNTYTIPKFIQYNGYTASIEFPKSGSIEEITTQHTKEFVNIHDSWGTGVNDTHFINYAAQTGSEGDYNVGHIDTRYHFLMVGDTEYYSSSYGKASDFSDSSRFYNRIQVTENLPSYVKYDSFLPTTVAAGGKFVPSNTIASLQLKGRMMGKTRYFWTGSTGDIILPSNHVSRYVDHYLNRIKQGTQNTDPGFHSGKQEDYSTSSFYRVKVTGGETQAYAGTATLPTLDSDDKIMR